MKTFANYDVRPSAENLGLIIRAKVTDGCTKDALKKHLADVQAETTSHLKKMADYQTRDIHSSTVNGLTILGPSSPDAGTTIALAYNAAMTALDEQVVTLTAQVAALAASVAVLEGAKKN
jgi:hypothetical protein